MPFVKPIEGRRGGLFLRLLNRVSRVMYGREMLQPKLLAHNPRFLLPYAGMSLLVTGPTVLPPEIRAYAMRLVSELNDCAWCRDFGRAVHTREGVSADKLDAVLQFASDPRFTPAERAALAYAEAVATTGAPVTGQVRAELRRHFSDRAIVELTVATVAEALFSRFNTALEVEPQGFSRSLSGAG